MQYISIWLAKSSAVKLLRNGKEIFKDWITSRILVAFMVFSALWIWGETFSHISAARETFRSAWKVTFTFSMIPSNAGILGEKINFPLKSGNYIWDQPTRKILQWIFEVFTGQMGKAARKWTSFGCSAAECWRGRSTEAEGCYPSHWLLLNFGLFWISYGTILSCHN